MAKAKVVGQKAYTPKEADRRRDVALREALKMSPIPHATMPKTKRSTKDRKH